ncbi:hypothetical protein K502DRAFT_54864 [Neoconidiobolus thromboides FSU 785]|nr:hypothetical protein K502DRAFT_54864 [Neoconidiobolus thromboides FSU 785]
MDRDYNIEISDNEPEEYEVETILSHSYHGHKFFYTIKWKNYDHEDNTIEPGENLENADEALIAYWTKIEENKGNKNLTKEEENMIEKYVPPGLIRQELPITLNYPPNSMGDWNDNIKSIANIYPIEDKVYVFIEWKTKHFTLHDIEDVKHKIPQKLIKYFEKHIVIMSDRN